MKDTVYIPKEGWQLKRFTFSYRENNFWILYTKASSTSHDIGIFWYCIDKIEVEHDFVFKVIKWCVHLMYSQPEFSFEQISTSVNYDQFLKWKISCLYNLLIFIYWCKVGDKTLGSSSLVHYIEFIWIAKLN